MIRLPDIPGLQGSAINAPAVRAGAVAASAEALGNLAQGIADVSEHFHNTAIQVQKQENARIVSEKRQQLAQAYADFQVGLQSDPDPASRMQKTSAFLGEWKGQMDDGKMAPAVRDELVSHFDSFATNAKIRQTEDSARLSVRRSAATFDNEISQAAVNKDMAAGEAAIQTAVASGIMLPEEGEAAKRKLMQNIALQQFQAEIGSDAAGWIERNPVDKVPDGMNVLQYQRLHEQAKEQVRGQTFEDVSTLQDLIVSGQISTPEELDAKAGHLRPMVVAKLKGQLQEMAADGYKARISSPEYQQGVVGKVSSMLADYKPMADDFDEKFVEMDGMVRQLPPGAIRDELTRRIDQVRSGKLQEVKTHADAAQKSLDEAYKAGRFGKVPEAVPIMTQKAINDGFLRDPSKLKRLGFSAAQVEEINAPISDKKPATDASRENAFKRLWEFREGKGKETADPLTLATANAIVQGQPKVDYLSPEAQNAAASARISAEKSFGAAKQKLAEWIKLNPKATPEQIDGKILEIGGEETHRKLSSGIYERKTAKAVPVDVKLSNYGYKSDTTPDSNSAAGIGHSNNKLTAWKSAAISKSLANRLGLQHGDEIQIETTQGSFRVFYHDTVPSEDSRTGPLTETIDIYRPQDGSNDWSGRVTSISKVS